MKQLSPLRRKLVVVAASVACMSGITPLLMREDRTLGWIWIGCMTAALVYVIVLSGKLKAEER